MYSKTLSSMSVVVYGNFHMDCRKVVFSNMNNFSHHISVSCLCVRYWPKVKFRECILLWLTIPTWQNGIGCISYDIIFIAHGRNGEQHLGNPVQCPHVSSVILASKPEYLLYSIRSVRFSTDSAAGNAAVFPRLNTGYDETLLDLFSQNISNSCYIRSRIAKGVK